MLVAIPVFIYINEYETLMVLQSVKNLCSSQSLTFKQFAIKHFLSYF